MKNGAKIVESDANTCVTETVEVVYYALESASGVITHRERISFWSKIVMKKNKICPRVKF